MSAMHLGGDLGGPSADGLRRRLSYLRSNEGPIRRRGSLPWSRSVCLRSARFSWRLYRARILKAPFAGT